jgi:hypothetical protein
MTSVMSFVTDVAHIDWLGCAITASAEARTVRTHATFNDVSNEHYQTDNSDDGDSESVDTV